MIESTHKCEYFSKYKLYIFYKIEMRHLLIDKFKF